MDIEIAKQLLDELLPTLEAMEAQSAAVLQFLKEKKGGEKQIAPYLERAENASSVRWRAIRVRTMSLLSSALKEGGDSGEKKPVAENQAPKPEAKDGSEGEKGRPPGAKPGSEKAAKSEPAAEPASPKEASTGETRPKRQAQPEAEKTGAG
ncbi:MAG TPA: hypothetical protein VLV49_04730 [Terriglobales bacterium]|nr:hypothetical protein [Terriglobales bacterium]